MTEEGETAELNDLDSKVALPKKEAKIDESSTPSLQKMENRVATDVACNDDMSMETTI